MLYYMDVYILGLYASVGRFAFYLCLSVGAFPASPDSRPGLTTTAWPGAPVRYPH